MINYIYAGQARLLEEADYINLDDLASEEVPADVNNPPTETTAFDDITKVKSMFH